MRPRHDIKSLQLNVEEAKKGRSWLLLPPVARASGDKYPLPSSIAELQELSTITIPAHKQDAGCVYLRRVAVAYKKRIWKRSSAVVDVNRQQNKAAEMNENFQACLRNLKAEARQAVAKVVEETETAIASLNDLFALGRKGIDGQMRAHLDGKKWQGEKISASAFRNCFRMVTQAVKGLGLPSGERAKAAEAVHAELAASLRATQEAVAMAPGGDAGKGDTEH